MDGQMRDAAYFNSLFSIDGRDVTIDERISLLLGILDDSKQEQIRKGLKTSMNVFKRNHRKEDFLKEPMKFTEHGVWMPEAMYAKMSDIKIDETMQRFVYWDSIRKILENYKSSECICIKVYRDKNGELLCWDGQHTLIALYYICVVILGLKMNEIDIPIMVSPGTDRADIRRASLGENGGNKVPFIGYDKYCFANSIVELDKSTDPEYLEINDKKNNLASYGMFLSDARMNSNHIAGALTRSNEIMDPAFHPNITEYFAQWCYHINGCNRPFGGTEVDLMYKYFDKCVNSGIEVTEEYVMDVAEVCKGINGKDFSADLFLERMQTSLERDLKEKSDAKDEPEYYMTSDGEVNRNQLKKTDEKMFNYFNQVLESHDIAVPEYDKTWNVEENELF
jgi:hypothetical protein